jgi:hypothetical protein
MAGTFTIGLLEVFAYLLPGSIVCVGILYCCFPSLIDAAPDGLWEVGAFLAGAYVIGHVLTIISVGILKAREFLKRVQHRTGKGKVREQRLPFYQNLRSELRKVFGDDLARDDEYQMCLRLVTDFSPESQRDVDRLYALTLFARNGVAAFVIATAMLAFREWKVSLISFVLALLFFVRYVQLEQSTSDTVFRSAYVLLRTKGSLTVTRTDKDPD